MTSDTVPLNGLSLTLNSPISPARLDALVAALARHRPQRVLDLGCGWAELLLRVVAAVPGSVGTGIDNEPVDIERGQALAEERGLTDRVRLITGDVAEIIADRAPGADEAYDLVLCVGAHHAVDPDPARTLQALRGLVADGGRLLFAVDYWLQPPPPERLALMWGGASLDDSCRLPEVVESAAAAGWRLLDLQETSQQEWNAYECGLVANQEEWLLAHPDHPKADELRQRLDQGRSAWLRGHHGYLGFAWLTLAAMPQW